MEEVLAFHLWKFFTFGNNPYIDIHSTKLLNLRVKI